MLLPNVGIHDRARMQESARRRRMLEGIWENDLLEAMSAYVSPEQFAAWGRPDTSSNVFRSTVNQLAVLYDRPVVIGHDTDETSAAAMREITKSAAVWEQAPNLQRLVIGQRESLRRVSWDNGRVTVRLVPVDRVTAESSPDDPANPHTVTEYRPREYDGKRIVTRDVLSVANPDAPVYRVETGDGGRDLTAYFLGGEFSGDRYPYRDQTGAPVLPYALTHANGAASKLFDPYEGSELVTGSLKVAVLWSFWSHILFDCSFPQKYGVNARPAGLSSDPNTDENATYIATDPASLLLMEAVNPESPVALGQFAPGGDPVAVGRAISEYQSLIAQQFDVGPSDIARSHADARSGYALIVQNEGKRAAQRKYEVGHRAGDLTLMRICAVVHNTYSGGARVAESGYTIDYRPLPLSVDERRTRIDEYRTRAELGVASAVQLLAELEGLTENQARARLEQIRRDRLAFGA